MPRTLHFAILVAACGSLVFKKTCARPYRTWRRRAVERQLHRLAGHNLIAS